MVKGIWNVLRVGPYHFTHKREAMAKTCLTIYADQEVSKRLGTSGSRPYQCLCNRLRAYEDAGWFLPHSFNTVLASLSKPDNYWCKV